MVQTISPENISLLSFIYAKQIIWYLLKCKNDRLLKKTVFAFEI